MYISALRAQLEIKIPIKYQLFFYNLIFVFTLFLFWDLNSKIPVSVNIVNSSPVVYSIDNLSDSKFLINTFPNSFKVFESLS